MRGTSVVGRGTASGREKALAAIAELETAGRPKVDRIEAPPLREDLPAPVLPWSPFGKDDAGKTVLESGQSPWRVAATVRFA